jgi:hypothetical protein
MNLLDDFNFEFHAPPTNITVRKCGYCRQPGHQQRHCRAALSYGHNLHLFAINLRNNYRNEDGTYMDTWEDVLFIYLSSLSSTQLKLLMNSDQHEYSRYVNRLLVHHVITVSESLLDNRNDRIKVLMWYYWLEMKYNNQHSNRKIDLNISVDTEMPNNTFDCPICLETKESDEKVITNCHHFCCSKCIGEYFCHLNINNAFKKPSCSLCRTEIVDLKINNTKTYHYFVDLKTLNVNLN